jgi:glycerophosphoryl diester phosphodiesterase
MPAIAPQPEADPPRPSLRRVGHKGADHIAPGNTLASFDAALDHGCDMIEFDVLPREHRGDYETTPLILAHDYGAAAKGVPPTLDEGLAHFAQDAFANVELDVDLKLPGYEARVLAALREHGLVQRALVSTQYVESLRRLRALEPSVRLGWSVPKASKDYLASPLTRLPAAAILAGYRATLPFRARRAIADGRINALMSHWLLVTPRLVKAIGQAGGELYVWTVDDAPTIRRLEAMGVTGVISNDPRLFDER